MLEASNICVKYGKHQVLHNLSLHVSQGDCIGILGINGCGKSTLLKALAGILVPSSGTITYHHTPLYHGRKCQRPIGYVPQDNPLLEDLTVLDNLKLWYGGHGKSLQKRMAEPDLQMLDLSSILNQKAAALSGGQKKRLSIACALFSDSPILILDEPTASLDIPCKQSIRRYISSYIQNGGTVILSTHEEPDIRLCNKLYLLRDMTLREISPDINNTASYESFFPE